jgi:hypothetical protein
MINNDLVTGIEEDINRIEMYVSLLVEIVFQTRYCSSTLTNSCSSIS